MSNMRQVSRAAFIKETSRKHTGCPRVHGHNRAHRTSVLEMHHQNFIFLSDGFSVAHVFRVLLEVVQDIKHGSSVPLLSHHKALKETEPSRTTLILDLCTEQKHVYKSYLSKIRSGLASGRRWFYLTLALSFYFLLLC